MTLREGTPRRYGIAPTLSAIGGKARRETDARTPRPGAMARFIGTLSMPSGTVFPTANASCAPGQLLSALRRLPPARAAQTDNGTQTRQRSSLFETTD
jgi:hypothetical protein